MAVSLQSSLESILILVLQSADVKKDRCLFLMDNDPSQTSKGKAMEKSEAEFHKIPATSPDLNPIENLFHLVKKSLENEAIANNIT
jgi:transposase